MQKIYQIGAFLAIFALLFACTEKNTPTDTTDPEETQPVDTAESVDDEKWTDTLHIVWNGASATVEGKAENVSVTNENGYVTIQSSTTNLITYLLSGNGTGQLSIYGSIKHNISLNDLTLTCSDGPAINNQCHKKCFVVLNGANSLTDGSSYASTDEDRKAALFSEGQLIFSGEGSLAVRGNYKHAIASDDYIRLNEGLGALNLTAASDGLHANDGIYIDGGTTTINAGNDGIQCDSIILIKGGSMNITATDKGIVDSLGITISGGTIRVSSEYKCIKTKANLLITGGDIQVICTGQASSSGGGGWPGWGGDSSSSSPEGIEAKGTITISGGYVYSQSADDAINSGGDMTISGGCVCAYSTGNDGIDANGNCYIQGGLVYAVGSRDPELAIDANSEDRKQLYIEGGLLIAMTSLERGAQLTQACYQASNASSNTWYAMTVGEQTVAFKTLTSGKLVVSGSSKPEVYKSVTPAGTAILNGLVYYPATYTGGSSVSLSTYSSNSGGGGRPGGGW